MAWCDARLTFDRTKEIRDDYTPINLIALFVVFRFFAAHRRGTRIRILRPVFPSARIFIAAEIRNVILLLIDQSGARK